MPMKVKVNQKIPKKKYQLKKNYMWWAALGVILQYGIPMSYIVWAYDILEFKGQSITGWGIILIGIVVILIKNKVQDFFIDYNKHLSDTAKRGQWGLIFLTVALFLLLSKAFIESLLIFFLVLAGSNLLSLLAYAPYDKKKKDYIETKELLERKRLDEKLKGLS